MAYYIVNGQLLEVDDPASMAQLQSEGIKPLNPGDFNDRLKANAVQVKERLATNSVLYKNPKTGEEEAVPRSALIRPGAEAGLQARGLEQKHSTLGAAGRGFLDKALFGGGEEVAAGLTSMLPGHSYGKDYENLVKNRREAVSESPRAGAIGQAGGATVGSPLPPQLAAGKTLLGTAGKLALEGTAASFAGGALGTEGNLDERLKAGVESAKYGAPISLALGLPLAPLARKLPETVDALDDHRFGLFNPSVLRDPRVLRNEAGAARISSTRASPNALYSAVGKTGFSRPGESPAESIIRLGDEMNGLTSVEAQPQSAWQKFWTRGKQQPILGKDATAPKIERSMKQEADKAGGLIGAAEQTAEGRGARVNVGDYYSKVGGIGDRLDQSRPPAPISPVLMEEVLRKTEPLPSAAQPGPRFDLTPPEASAGVQRLRARAKEGHAQLSAQGMSPHGADYPLALDKSAGVLAGMKNSAIDSVLTPEELAALQTARRNYAVSSTVDEATNAMKQMSAAPVSLPSMVAGAGGATVGTLLTNSPTGAIAGRGIGSLLARQRNINPAKASRYYGLARGLEGDPLTRGGDVARFAVQGAKNPALNAMGGPFGGIEGIPSTLERGQGLLGGDDLTDEDQTSLSLRRIIADRLRRGQP